MASLDLYSPFCLIVGGLLGLGYFGILGRFLARRPRTYLAAHIEAVQRRFRSRQRISWVMLAFGVLWLLQIVLEQRPPQIERLLAKAAIQVRDPAGK